MSNLSPENDQISSITRKQKQISRPHSSETVSRASQFSHITHVTEISKANIGVNPEEHLGNFGTHKDYTPNKSQQFSTPVGTNKRRVMSSNRISSGTGERPSEVSCSSKADGSMVIAFDSNSPFTLTRHQSKDLKHDNNNQDRQGLLQVPSQIKSYEKLEVGAVGDSTLLGMTNATQNQADTTSASRRSQAMDKSHDFDQSSATIRTRVFSSELKDSCLP